MFVQIQLCCYFPFSCIVVDAANTKVCDEKCQKRAKAGEVVIVSIVLIIALISGKQDIMS